MVLNEGDSGEGSDQDAERKRVTHSLEMAVSCRLDSTRGRVAQKAMTLEDMRVRACVCVRRRANVQRRHTWHCGKERRTDQDMRKERANEGSPAERAVEHKKRGARGKRRRGGVSASER